METKSALTFSWKQFWETFIYENLPPVLFSPIAALLIEKSAMRAWHVCQNRGLCVVSAKSAPLSFILWSWLIVYPCSWIITLGFLKTVFFNSGPTFVDPYQVILAFMFLFMRRLIISIKYGYFTAEEVEDLARPAPEWTFDRMRRKLVGIGWSAPTNFDGLIESEIDALATGRSRLFEKGQLILRKVGGSVTPPGSTLSAEPNKNDDRYVDSKFNTKSLLHAIVCSTYSEKKPAAYDLWVALMALSIAVVPPLLHYLIYADSLRLSQDPIIHVARFLGCMSGIGIMGFGLVCAFDFGRRQKGSVLINNLVFGEGLALKPLEGSEYNLIISGDGLVKLDLDRPAHILAFMELRDSIVKFGEQFYKRIQGYTSVLLLCALCCVVLLNSIVWTSAPHHVTTIVMILLIILAIGSIRILAMIRAIPLQRERVNGIDLLRRYVISANKDGAETEVPHAGIRKDSNDVEMMSRLIDYATFHDLTHSPTSLLGTIADNKLVSSVLGALITGCLLALQGFVNLEIAYDIAGWSIP